MSVFLPDRSISSMMVKRQLAESGKSSLLTYWEGLALTIPLLSKIALSVYSIVPSEASVERSFSHQSIVHSDLRNKLSDEAVQSVMFVRMNVGNFFDVPQVVKKK